MDTEATCWGNTGRKMEEGLILAEEELEEVGQIFSELKLFKVSLTG